MPEITYTGHSDVVSFVKDDFVRHGIEDQGAVHFDAKNDFTATVSDAAWEFLKGRGGFSEVFKLSEASGEPATVADTGDVESTADTAAPEASTGRRGR